jgi:molybdate transport system substrate-binding protein
MRRSARHIFVAAALMTGCAPAMAADITVFAPGIASVGLRKLADAWTLQTGNKVTITGANVGRILTSVNGNVPADLVLLPPDNLKEIAAKLQPGSSVALGRALFGMAVKAGGPHPDLSTLPKFAAALKGAGVIGYPDPLVGSLSGAMVEQMLKRPEFAGVAGRPLKENAANIVKNGDAPFSGGVISEEITDPGAELVGLFPAALDMHIDLSVAVLSYAAAPQEAAAFLRYIARPEAAAVWHGCGIEANDDIVTAPRMACPIPPPRPPGQ